MSKRAGAQIERPIFVIGAPRSGTTILYRALCLHADLWHLPGESHSVIEGPFHPRHRGFDSNRLLASDAETDGAAQIRRDLFRKAVNLSLVSSSQERYFKGSSIWRRLSNRMALNTLGWLSRRKRGGSNIRLLEKTPKNALRTAFLAELFPDALFLMNVRSAETNIDSLIAGWSSEDRFGPFRRQRFGRAGYDVLSEAPLQDYASSRWKFALVPGWRELKGRRIADAAALQYRECHRAMLADAASIGDDRVLWIRHEEFVAEPGRLCSEILSWSGLPASAAVEAFADRLPRINESATTRKRSGLRYESEVQRAISECEGLSDLARELGYDRVTT